MKYTTFEEFLKDWHMSHEYNGTDDDAPDAFEHWLSEKEVGDLLPLADIYGKEMELLGKKEAREIVTSTLNS